MCRLQKRGKLRDQARFCAGRGVGKRSPRPNHHLRGGNVELGKRIGPAAQNGGQAHLSEKKFPQLRLFALQHFVLATKNDLGLLEKHYCFDRVLGVEREEIPEMTSFPRTFGAAALVLALSAGAVLAET